MLQQTTFAYVCVCACVYRCRVKKTTFSSAQTGVRESNEITIDGRVIFDVFQAIQRDYKLHSYSLNAVCAKFLGEQKEDVHHSIISDLQNGDAESRRRLAVYCLKDAYLPQRLMDKLMFLFNYMEMARVTGVPLGWLLVRGQMLKVMSQLLRKSQQKHLLIPALQSQPSDDTYEGATVIEPIKGFYSEPIATCESSKDPLFVPLPLVPLPATAHCSYNYNIYICMCE